MAPLKWNIACSVLPSRERAFASLACFKASFGAALEAVGLLDLTLAAAP
jgi:hypothetical protein